MAKEKSVKYIANVNESDETVNETFANLLAQLPNGGKLYKYRALKTFHEDELEEQYLWFSSAANLNDSKDCAFNMNIFEEIEDLVKYWLKDNRYRNFMVTYIHNELGALGKRISREDIEECLSCASKYGIKFAKKRVEFFCRKHRFSKEQQDIINEAIDICMNRKESEALVRKSVISTIDTMLSLRNRILVCSLTTSYRKDNMWAYYCCNEGICIEYDFAKIDSIEHKKVFKNLFRVRYGKKPRIKMTEIFDFSFNDDISAKKKIEEKIWKQLLTKDKSWATEDEWRVFYVGKENENGKDKSANFISAIYIDNSVLRWKKTRKILKLANENGWQIYVRYFDTFVAEYKYDTIEKARKALKRMKMTTNRG